MGILRSEGFAGLLEAVVTESRGMEFAHEAVRHSATLGGRLSWSIGLAALTAPEAMVFEALERTGAGLSGHHDDQAGGERLALTETGRLRILADGEPSPAGVHLVARVDWRGSRPADLDQEYAARRRAVDEELAAVKEWLLDRPADQVRSMLERLRFTLSHVGPMRVYVAGCCYTNLGRDSNLIGKSVSADSKRCRVGSLSDLPPAEWTAEDATFVVCMTALISSGTPSRTEEMSGMQLTPSRLEEYVRDLIAHYDGRPQSETDDLPALDRLFALAAQARELRVETLRRGRPIYRTVQAMTITKREGFLDGAVTMAELPPEVEEKAYEYLPGADLTEPDRLIELWAEHADDLYAAGRADFTTRFEELLHELVCAATEATGSHAGMSRGPRNVGRLSRLVASGSEEPGHWKTSDYYCCVVPGRSFRERFRSAPDELPQVIKAIAARMRWNSWHFMPHSSGAHEHESLADRDWFFAPSMPDMTEWTSHHHQGHVANGVRHAIRVPLALELSGDLRPGVHDFRLMRTDGEVYALGDLRAAIAVGQMLAGLYQAHATWLEKTGRELLISDFTNPWYQQRYGPVPVHP